MTDWQDQIVGARMAVDERYRSTIAESRFSMQEWGLIMTAVEFDIDDPEDDDHASLVADTSNLDDIMPELEKVANMQGGMPGMAQQDSGGGLLDSVRGALGIGDDGDDVDESKILAAESLVDGYANELQAHLEEKGRWAEVRASYRESQ